MTEIPEHLLRRSRERREALGLSQPGDEAAAAPASSAVEPVEASAAPAPVARPGRPVPVETPPPPVRPDPPYIAAAKRRKRIPFWAMPVLVFLPVWAAIYAFTLEPPSAGASDPLALGGALYNGKATCAACHGGSGEGGVGPAFQNGAVEKTWPNWRDHFLWVKTGADAWPGDNYGAEQTPKDKVPGVMPGFGPGSGSELTDDEILLVMRYEREVLGGGEPDPVLVQLTECAAAGQDLSSILDALQPGTGAGGTSEPPATPESCTP